MNWIEVSLQTNGEAAEAVTDLLQQYGYQGVVIEQTGVNIDAWEDNLPAPENITVRAYIPEDDQAVSLKQKLEDGLYQLHRIYPLVPQAPTYNIVAEENWAEAWKAHYKPLRVGQHVYIRPAWMEGNPLPGDTEIVLDPGAAFGTGTHPTTQLCLVAEEALAPLPTRILDLGCGSGILSIGAAKLGAEHIWSLDIDAMAVKATGENAKLNNVQHQLTIQQGSLKEVLNSGQQFDLILVNILAKIIIPMCEQGLGQVVVPGGIAVFAGLIEEQVEDVEAALRATGLTPYKRRTIGEWVGIEARRD